MSIEAVCSDAWMARSRDAGSGWVFGGLLGRMRRPHPGPGDTTPGELGSFVAAGPQARSGGPEPREDGEGDGQQPVIEVARRDLEGRLPAAANEARPGVRKSRVRRLFGCAGRERPQRA